MAIRDIIDTLKGSKRTQRTDDVLRILDGLGFSYRRGALGRHYVVKHAELSKVSGFKSWNFNGESVVQPSYVTQLIRVLETYADDLEGLGYE